MITAVQAQVEVTQTAITPKLQPGIFWGEKRSDTQLPNSAQIRPPFEQNFAIRNSQTAGEPAAPIVQTLTGPPCASYSGHSPTSHTIIGLPPIPAASRLASLSAQCPRTGLRANRHGPELGQCETSKTE